MFDGMLVVVEAFREATLQFCQVVGEFTMSGDGGAQFHKGADDKHTHRNRPVAVQHVGGHDCAMFGERIRQVLDIVAPLQGRKLRP